jgi:TRAP transporter TAXI family solute receptor
MNEGFSTTEASGAEERPDLAFVKAQEQTIRRSLALPPRGTLAAIVFLVAVVLGIGAWLIYNQTRVYEITLASGGSTTTAFGNALAEIVAEAEPRIHITVEELSGTVECMQKLQNGEVQLAFGQTDVDAGSQIRTISYLYPELFHLAVRTDSGIETPADLKGKRVATPGSSSGSYASFQFVMTHYGLTDQDVTIVPLAADEINPAFLNGEVDAVFRNLPLGETRTRALLASGQAQLIPFEQVAAMRVPRPYMIGVTVPQGTYRAARPAVPADDLNTIGVQNVLFANADLPDYVAKAITRVLYEHQNALVNRNALAAFISSPLEYENAIGPALHPGSLAYYEREKPNFFQRYYNEITFLFMIAPLFGSGYLAIRAQMAAKQKRKINDYQQQLIQLLDSASQVCETGILSRIEFDMIALLSKVMQDLDEGIFEMEDVQTFSFGWEKAIDFVRHKQELAVQARA